LDGVFDPHLSTDRVRVFKPDPRAYEMALAASGATRDEIVFADFSGWDAAGAKAFGYPTFWVNRARPARVAFRDPLAHGEAHRSSTAAGHRAARCCPSRTRRAFARRR
jgi:FMN phosphatase YigB (HAD superfamily)